MKHDLKLLILGTCCALALSACSNAKKDLGLVKEAPDEFAVVKRAPLAMPPDYTLRPPRPGMARPQETPSDEEARTTVFGNAAPARVEIPAGIGGGESALLQQAGAAASPHIREKVDRETDMLEPREKPVAERLLGIGSGKQDAPPATVVDAKAEAERLKNNLEQGKDVTEGETPSKEE